MRCILKREIVGNRHCEVKEQRVVQAARQNMGCWLWATGCLSAAIAGMVGIPSRSSADDGLPGDMRPNVNNGPKEW